MKAWRVHELGQPAEVLRLEDVPIPEAGDGQVLVKVRAAALNFPDLLMIAGKYQERPALPFVPGVELTGEVLGSGERVLGAPAVGSGGFAEYAVLDAATALPVPDAMPDHAAAALFLTYQTGHVGLHRRAGLKPGEVVLVHAGAGGVGSAAIQLAKAGGATVIATAGGPDKVAICLELGADHAIDYLAGDFVGPVKELTDGRGADIIYDPVGGDVFDSSRRCVAFEGRIVVVGFTSGRIADAPTNHALVKNYSVVGLHWGLYRRYEPSLIHAVHAELLTLYARGSIKPLVSQTLPLAEAVDALSMLGRRATVGKVVLMP